MCFGVFQGCFVLVGFGLLMIWISWDESLWEGLVLVQGGGGFLFCLGIVVWGCKGSDEFVGFVGGVLSLCLVSFGRWFQSGVVGKDVLGDVFGLFGGLRVSLKGLCSGKFRLFEQYGRWQREIVRNFVVGRICVCMYMYIFIVIFVDLFLLWCGGGFFDYL